MAIIGLDIFRPKSETMTITDPHINYYHGSLKKHKVSGQSRCINSKEIAMFLFGYRKGKFNGLSILNS